MIGTFILSTNDWPSFLLILRFDDADLFRRVYWTAEDYGIFRLH